MNFKTILLVDKSDHTNVIELKLFSMLMLMEEYLNENGYYVWDKYIF